ncbi:hypothetical protein F4677DRAFT_156010 [Hypoxylon crocopeplum]|nr:hypothetical protein F4677DRAFT_156010 [Hypoxylon crocopeplum]
MATITPHARSSLRRTACDRCRHSKLRCFRDENQQKCARCLRLELRCEVAPAKPPGRPRKVMSIPVAADIPTDDVEVLSPQSIERNHSPEAGGSVLPGQSPENLLLGLDNHIQVNSPLSQMSSALQSGGDGFNLTSILPLSEFRTPEWFETSCFDPEPPNRDPLEVHSLFTAKLDRHECFKELSQLNVDLHVHWGVLKELIDTGQIKFSSFIDHLPPPAGDGVSRAEKLLIMSQRFQQAVTNLNWVVKHEPKPLHATMPVIFDEENVLDPLLDIAGPLPTSFSQDTGSYPTTSESRGVMTESDELLETPFVCLLVSCYVQMIQLFEIMFVHVHRRIDGLDRDRLTLSDPGKGITMGAFYIYSGRLQSMFYCQAVLYFLENIERGLGILLEQMEHSASGLLSHPQHFNLLQRELGGQVCEGISERVRALRETVEKARICSLQDVGW